MYNLYKWRHNLMDKLQQKMIYIISPVLLLTVFYSLMSNANTVEWLFIPIMGVSMLIIYMEFFILPEPHQMKWFWIGYSALAMGTTCIGIFGKDQVYHVFYLLILFMLIRYVKGKSIVGGIGVIALLMGAVMYVRTHSGHDLLVNWFQTMAMYAGALIAMGMIEYMIRMNQSLTSMQIRLVEKNMDLSHAYEQLRRAYDELEDYTIMKERTYMSREMHDTVGHTLTAALVELELCKMLVKDYDEAAERVTHITEQVRKGLSDLRVTVRKLKEDLDWEQEIQAIGERISSYTDIKVRMHLDSLKGIDTDTLRCIYRIIQESLTNGMKHGKATAFMIEVALQEEWINIEIMDNGKGATAFKQGFGLNAMTERVEALKGRIEFESYKDEGFTVRAHLPKTYKKEQS